jgi:hypothetical protein
LPVIRSIRRPNMPIFTCLCPKCTKWGMLLPNNQAVFDYSRSNSQMLSNLIQRFLNALPITTIKSLDLIIFNNKYLRYIYIYIAL